MRWAITVTDLASYIKANPIDCTKSNRTTLRQLERIHGGEIGISRLVLALLFVGYAVIPTGKRNVFRFHKMEQ